MNTFIIIIIAVAVSAVFTIALKLIDKDKNSMEKVKRYADKRLGEFETYFGEKAKQIKMHSAELDGQQQQAVAAVKKLEIQIDEFKEMIHSLEKDTGAVHSIEEKINAYGSKIETLSEMTSAVEENLNKIKAESNYISKVNDKLAESKSSLDKIEKQIPVVIQEFSKRNSEQLKIIGADLLKKYDDRSKEIEINTKNAVEQYEEVRTRINSDVSGIYSNAAKKVEALEDDAFKRLSVLSQERIETYKTQVEQSENSIKKYQTELEEQLAEMQERYDSLFDEAISKADEKEKAAYEKYTNTAKNHIETFKTNVEEKIHTMQDTIKQNLADLKTQTAASAKDAKAAITELKASCQDAVAEAKESGKEVSAHKEEVEAAIAKFEKDTSNKIAEVNKRLEDAVKKAIAIYGSKQAENLLQLDKQLDQYKKDMYYRLERLETSGQDIDQLEKVLHKSMVETQNHVMAEFKVFTEVTLQKMGII